VNAKLVIFCTSARPDPYLNVILHGALSLGFREFALVAVDDSSAPRGAEVAARAYENLSRLVDVLRSGEYSSALSNGLLSNPLPLDDPQVFIRSLDVSNWDSLAISRRGLKEEELLGFLEAELADGSSFDVTACKNSLVAGIAAALVARGRSEIYTFDLMKAPTYGPDDLYPSLRSADFIYRRLSDAPLMQDSLTRVKRFSLERKQFLVWALILAVVVSLLSIYFPETVVFSLLTGFASFAGIASAINVFTRN
jgi:hypothetical protein